MGVWRRGSPSASGKRSLTSPLPPLSADFSLSPQFSRGQIRLYGVTLATQAKVLETIFGEPIAHKSDNFFPKLDYGAGTTRIPPVRYARFPAVLGARDTGLPKRLEIEPTRQEERCKFHFTHPALWKAFCIKLLYSQPRKMVKCT